jgi:hypothetical protein
MLDNSQAVDNDLRLAYQSDPRAAAWVTSKLTGHLMITDPGRAADTLRPAAAHE